LIVACARLLPFGLLPLAAGSAQESPVPFPGTAVKVEQLTGDNDRARGIATRSRTGERFGLGATDLGSSFEHDGKLWFLFGDSAGRPRARDAIAWTEAETPEDLVLEFPLAEDGLWAPLTVEGIGQAAFEIPSYGISVGGRVYAVFTTDHSQSAVMGRSVFTLQDEDRPARFHPLWDLSSSHFINVALATARRSDFRGLPASRNLLIWGSGTYRRSSVRLACLPEGRVEQRAALRYLQRVDADGRPSWSKQEEDALPLFEHDQVGEFSVAWIAPLKRWLMLYNSEDPRGIVMRTAELPWGPWSEARVLFDPFLDHGYGHFLHAAHVPRRLDNFHDPGHPNKWGGEYGPYLIPRFVRGDEERCTVFFTMSVWNPYQVVLMRADIGYPERFGERRKLTTTTAPTDDEWTVNGEFLRPFERNGRRHWSTHAKWGDGDRGVAHRALLGSRDGALEFTIHGGHAEIVLVRETQPPPEAIPVTEVTSFHRALKNGAYGPVVECIRGPNSNEVDVDVRWSLDRFLGQPLRLYVVDSETQSWGFVSFSDFRIVEWRDVGPGDDE
jgi:uncharacterized protein DUF4185